LKVATARVVLIDDEELFLSTISRILTRAGYEVLPANRPHQALEIVRNNAQIDLVISDVNMPEMRGMELVREIARIRPGIASLLFTGGLIDPAEVPEGVPILRKPFSTAELISAASAAMERFAQIATDFARTCQKSAELQVQSQQLISECQNVAREAAETIREALAQRTPRDKDAVPLGPSTAKKNALKKHHHLT